MRRRVPAREFQGLGVYQQVGRGHDPSYGTNYERYNPGNVFQGYGAYEVIGGLGQAGFSVPGLDTLVAPVVINGLQHVDTTYKTAIQSGLEMLSFQQENEGVTEPVLGEATYHFSLLGSGWLDNLIEQGYVVLVSPLNVSTGSVGIAASKNPQFVYQNAKVGGDYSIFAGPSSIIAAAEALGSQAPVTPPPGGGAVVPPGGGAVAPVEEKKLPGWVLPTVIGGSILLITIGIVAMTRKSGKASPAISYTSY